MNEMIVSHEEFRDDNFIDLRINKKSYEQLLSELSKQLETSSINKKTSKNYYFDYFIDKSVRGQILRNHGLVLRIFIEAGLPKVHLKINRMLRDPKNSSIFSRFDYICQIKSIDILKKILAGEKPLLSLEEKDCKMLDSIKHPIAVTKKYLRSEVLGKRGIPRRIPLASIKPIAVNQITSHNLVAEISGQKILFHIEKIIYPKGVVGYSLFVDFKGIDSLNKFHTIFNYLQQKGISYAHNSHHVEDLTFLISYAEETDYLDLLRSGYLTKKDMKIRL